MTTTDPSLHGARPDEDAHRATMLERIRARLTGDVRARILAYYFVLLAVALLAATLLVRQALLVRLDDAVAADLRQEAQEFRRLAGGNDPETGRPFRNDVERILEVFLERNVPGVGEQLIAVPRQGAPVYRGSDEASEPPGPALIAGWRMLSETEEGEIETAAGPARYLAVPTIADGRPLGTFVVEIFLDSRREEVTAAVRIVAVVSGAVLILASLIAYLAAGRVLSPLSELRDAAHQVSGEDMSRRIEVAGTDEIAQLGETFNRMLDRLQAAFAIQSSFIRDASHELRTPIAIVRGHLELLVDGEIKGEEEIAETLELLNGELERMTRFVDDLLLLAKSEHPDFLRPETVALDELCDELVAKARGLGERDWTVEGAVRRTIVADRQRLTQAVMSLADNAVSNTEEGDAIAIGASIRGQWARIWVRDQGPGIPAEEQDLVFEPLQRGSGRRRYEGTGLGLALVRAIAEAHGGHVELRSAEGQGTEVELVMPVEGPGGEEIR